MAGMDERLNGELAQAQRRLLDLTLRNRLLNFRPTRRTTIRVADELPAEVWRLLAAERRALAFLAREEHERFAEGQPGAGQVPPAPADPGGPADPAAAGDELFELPALETALEAGEEQLPRRYTDRFLQTPLSGEDLQTNLLRIYHAAGSALEERGVNLLFLAVGFLAWRSAEHGERVFKAPLVLIPVALERTSARSRFKLSALDDDPAFNPPLAEKLYQDHRIELPAEPEQWDEFDVDGHLRAVGQAVADRSGWEVLPEICLGLFSFTKYLMYVDLDARRWPAGRALAGNPLIQRLCGAAPAGAPAAGLPGPAGLEPAEVFQVLDADSSQQRAIAAAKAGASLVVEGPPGTGKSQTIANMIAECLAAGKTVLFVSEKMAALEVVKRRLDAVGLGEFCLELHSTKASRRAVRHELGRVLAKPRPRPRSASGDAERLVRLRSRLDEYVAALHAPFGPAGLTPHEAIGRIALLADVPDIVCEMPGCERWDPQQAEEMKDLVDRLARQLQAVWGPCDHPWRGARITQVTGQVQRSTAEAVGRLREALDGARSASAEAAERLGADLPAGLRQMREGLSASRAVAASPGPTERLLREGLWDDVPAELQALLDAIAACDELRGWLAGRYRPEAVDDIDWQGIHQRCQRYWAAVTRWLRPAYWSDRKAIRRARAADHRPGLAELAADLKKLARLQALREQIDAAAELGQKYFDRTWRGAADLGGILALAEWLKGFRALAAAGRIGPAGIDLAAPGRERTGLTAAADRLEGHLADWDEAFSALAETLQLDEADLFDTAVAETPLEVLAERLERMAGGVELLFDWARYQEALAACREGPLAGFVDRALADDIEPELLVLAVEKQWLALRMEDVLAGSQTLRQFSGPDHEADRREFAELDRRWIAETPRRLRARLAGERPSPAAAAARSSQLGVLQGEVRRKRGGRSIRSLLRDAADAVARLKPCLMMSPLSVAQFIDPAGMRFDVVVFDEASQVEPADALGAVARGRQLVLVGDSRQLPPTSFFDAVADADDPAASDEAAGLTDMESILDRGAVVLPSLRLRWHYRSRHESLIAFSNREFYDNDLRVFPSSHLDTDRLGLTVRYEPGDLYDRGRGQTNRAQARRIAEWVFDHARRDGGRSLGVGAFSVRQQQAILDEIEKLRRQDDSVEAFFDRSRPEPFFVKNLETIQGDERDVIGLSVGYGRGEPGERLSMNFGPLNQDKGWRRLNVLITRARRRCVVFTSICAADFDLSATSARGVHALKRYLEFASAGEFPRAGAAEADRPDSAFVQAVCNTLTERGVELRRDVGCAGFAVDLAVVDPDRPGGYVLGIECDGPTYRAATTARDRDRLREQVLAGLGWRLHRIWSVDWLRTPGKELERVLEAIARARRGPPASAAAPSAPAPAPSPPGEAAPAAAEAPAVLTQPYRHFAPAGTRPPQSFYTDPVAELAGVVGQIVRTEGPIHAEELMRRLAAAWGLTRLGSRVRDRAARAVALCASAGGLDRRGEFLWQAGIRWPPVRRREDDDSRDIDLICEEEIAAAARLVLKAQFGMNRQDLIVQTARALGFQVTGPKIAARIDRAVQAEIDAGRIAPDARNILQARQ